MNNPAARLIASMCVVGALGAGLGLVPGIAGASSGPAANAIEACNAAMSVEAGAKTEKTIKQTCAIACGQLATGVASSKPESDKVIDAARDLCVDACSVIFEVGVSSPITNGNDPVSIAVAACWTALTSGSDSLPAIENGGRHWR